MGSSRFLSAKKMNEYETFQQISQGAFSGWSFTLAEAALRCLHERYPNGKSLATTQDKTGYPAREHAVDPIGPVPPTEEEWIEYASAISQKSSDDEKTMSIYRVGHDDHLEANVVRESLELLRHQPALCVPIQEVRTLQLGPNNIGDDDGINSPAIIPFQDGDSWAFAVAYSDCIHWYDSRQGQQPPSISAARRQILNGWTGPKQCAERPQDSGIFMLLGIRCISQGAPHVSQEAADKLVPSFRARLVVELVCGKLEPSGAEFEQLKEREREEQSTFFDEAMNGIAQAAGPPITPPESVGPARNTASPDGLNQPTVEPPPAERRRTETDKQIHPRPAKSRSRRIAPDDRRLILENLSEAVLASRSTQVTAQSDLAVLWKLVRTGNVGSAFHQRYHAVLFCDKMESLRDRNAISRAMELPHDDRCVQEMNSMLLHCQFWRDVCNLCQDWGMGRYVVLLAVSRITSARSLRHREKQGLLSELRSRLTNRNDPLGGWLAQARELCMAVVANELPVDRLMIDVYGLKRYDALDDRSYGAYTSLDPRCKLPLPRV